MKRYAMEQLIEWKNRSDRMPLIIRGARQVGKTWLMRTFGKEHFKNIAYVNFDNNQRMQTLFKGDYDIKRLITALEIETDTRIEKNNTLIIFDEIQEVKEALSSLKYFRENAPEYAIIAAGSLLGVAMHSRTSFPVGKVDFMDLYPMNFFEFLEATGEGKLLTLLKSGDWTLIDTFRDKYINILKNYYLVGGMPEAVQAFENSGLTTIRRIQNRLLYAYEQDFSKHAPSQAVPRIRMLWDSIPAQLAKENKRFIYGQVQQGARAREFELAMQWLIDSGLIYMVRRVSKPGMPLSAYADTGAFKLYMLDVGLLGAKSDLDIKSVLDGNRIFEEFKGSLTEQYALQQLKASAYMPYYWAPDKGMAEVDFICQYAMEIIPIEVKAEENLKARSLKSYYDRYQPQHSVRTSMSGYRKEEWLTNIPLYAIGLMNQYI